MTAVTRRLLIHGRVQGVGFRWALTAEARKRGLSGWVRNRSNGSVEALVRGPSEAVAALTLWAHRGPPHAYVDRVTCQDEPDDNSDISGKFTQRPTL